MRLGTHETKAFPSWVQMKLISSTSVGKALSPEPQLPYLKSGLTVQLYGQVSDVTAARSHFANGNYLLKH